MKDMEANMDCPLGGTHDYQWDKELLKNVCSKCGKVSPFETMPTYLELVQENSLLKEKIKEMESLLNKGG